jgi:archaellum biogenesis ATPase FlaH
MDLTPDQVANYIRNSKHISDEQRLDIFEFLSEHFSLIPLRGGFPPPGKPGKSFKAAKEPNWNQWASEKRPFNRTNFEPERAGIACGPASGVLVLDVDDENQFVNWCAEHGVPYPLPRTMKVKTGGDGERFHYYFNYPSDGKEYKNRSVKYVFDIRGVGGYVLCPGSLHPETQEPYIIVDNTETADAPDWLLEYSLKKKTPKQTPSEPNRSEEIPSHTPGQPITEFAVPPISTSGFTFDANIDLLTVSDEIKAAIRTPYPKGQRSEASMRVLLALKGADVSTQQIEEIFQGYPIGEKRREAGDKWFEGEIKRAEEYLSDNENQSLSPQKVKTPPARYKVFNAMDIVSADVEFKFLIDRFWPLGEPLLITGYGGAGKSIMTLQIAMDLVNSTPQLFLDSFATHGQHKVLFVQSENAMAGMKQRISFIRSGYAISDQDLRERMVFLGVGNDIRSSGDMMKSNFQDTLKNCIESYQIDILVLDPLISFHSMDENSNDQMRQLLDSISMFCEETGVTPLLIHHHAKISSESGPGGGRGASAIGDWSPNTWELSSTAKGYKLAHKKARNFSLQVDLELDLVNLRFKPKMSSRGQNKSQFVVQALNQLGGTANTKKELRDELVSVLKQNKQKCSPSSAGKYIDAAVKDGSIKSQKAPTGNKNVYKLK